MIPQQLQIATANETELLTTTTLVFEKIESNLSMRQDGHNFLTMESLILAQDERWRRASYMQVDNGEFDPGSGRTLAACFIHASRTIRPLRGYISGGRVSNMQRICLQAGDNRGKLLLIPHMSVPAMVFLKAPALGDESASDQLVGGVMDHQGDDQQLV